MTAADAYRSRFKGTPPPKDMDEALRLIVWQLDRLDELAETAGLRAAFGVDPDDPEVLTPEARRLLAACEAVYANPRSQKVAAAWTRACRAWIASQAQEEAS